MRDHVDLLVVGAGIHGAGIAQAAAAAGCRVLVLEQTAVASGTSSRSSKLIHGGLRYLESGQWGLVRAALRERAILLRQAPDLVRLVPFHIPVYRDMRRRPWRIRVGLSLYALLGGLAPETRFTALPRRLWDRLDGLATAGLQAVFRYHDAQTDDAALTHAVMKSALALGARLACPASFVHASAIPEGYRVRYRDQATEHECTTRVLVNAAGPWVNQVLDHVAPAPLRMGIELVQGTHMLIPGRLSAGMYYVEAPRDRRAVFFMPWREHTLVGTTETPYRGEPGAVRPLEEEIVYLQSTAARYFPDRDVTPLEQFAGLRVLPATQGAAFHRPRSAHIVGDEGHRLITVYGGKLTTYRVTANDVLHRAAGRLSLTRPADTAELTLSP